MSRRGLTLVVVSVLILVLGVVGSLMPVPYVALSPGPTTNTLGPTPDKKAPLIEIQGHPVYEDGGHLNFTTVSYQGGPAQPLDLFTALRGWLSDSTSVVPEEAIFPKNQSVQKVEQENTQQMRSSQQDAIAAALKELNVPLTTTTSIASVTKGLPADGKVKPSDKIISLDGTKTADMAAVTAIMKTHKPGDTVTLVLDRGSKQQKVEIKTVASPEDPRRAVMGVTLQDDYTFPFTVKISVGDVGGPSAGLMFSLGIYDKLTPGSLTGGKFVAGTGTITPEGKVGPIGGIQQKLIAARNAGATVFFTPADNCKDAVATAPKGLRLIRADTLDGAIKSLDVLRTGQGSLPACPRS
jgi:PDZ domain-containing protein